MVSPNNIHIGLYALAKNNPEVPGYQVIDTETSRAILEEAYNNGVLTADTAPMYGYGEADQLLKWARNEGMLFRVRSKIGRVNKSFKFTYSSDHARVELTNIKKAHSESLDCIYLHSPPAEMLSCWELIEEFRSLCLDIAGVQAGLSLESPSHLALIPGDVAPLEIQFNWSWFDTRAAIHLEEISQSGHRMIGRSIFGSGFINEILEPSKNSQSLDETDVRSSWNMKHRIIELYHDASRVREVASILRTRKVDRVAFSITKATIGIKNYVIGPTKCGEIESSARCLNESISGGELARLMRLIDCT